MVDEKAVLEGRASLTNNMFPSRPGTREQPLLRKYSSATLSRSGSFAPAASPLKPKARRASSISIGKKNALPPPPSLHNRFAPHHQNKQEENPGYADEVEEDFAAFIARGERRDRESADVRH